MSKFDLRDISERLSRSRDTEGVVAEFLGYLQRIRPDWKATLAFYEVSKDCLVSLYQRTGARLRVSRIHMPVDQLPARLVRKFFHPSAFFNDPSRRSLLSVMFQTSPYYEPDLTEAGALAKIAPLDHWESAICLPLADREDVMALVMIASEKKGAFPSRLVAEILPAKSMAALALAQNLHRSRLGAPATADRISSASARHAAATGDFALAGEPPTNGDALPFQDHIRKLHERAVALNASNQEKERRLEELAQQVEDLDRNSTEYQAELERVKAQLVAIEEQAGAATDQLNRAYTELSTSQQRLGEIQRTVSFIKEVFQVLSQEYEGQEFSRTLVSWFCEHMGVERCSLMVPTVSGEALRMGAHRGIDPEIANRVRVRVGQGIAGWVAHNRKPLLVQFRNEVDGVAHTDQDSYNSDSFVCVPLIHNNRLRGVLNLSNKRDGDQFDETDLERAQIAGSILAMALEQSVARRSAEVWG